jgi:hypothetical protein
MQNESTSLNGCNARAGDSVEEFGGITRRSRAPETAQQEESMKVKTNVRAGRQSNRCSGGGGGGGGGGSVNSGGTNSGGVNDTVDTSASA